MEIALETLPKEELIGMISRQRSHAETIEELLGQKDALLEEKDRVR